MTSVHAADAAQKAAVRPLIGSPIDVARERERTRGAGLSHHFNAAGSALPTSAVVSAVIEHLRLEERVGGYEAAARVKNEIEVVYTSAARLLNCGADEIALFDSASTGLRVLLDAFRPERGSRIIASRSTYVSHALHLMTLRAEHGIDLVLAPTDARRRVNLDALESLLADGRPTILTIAHIPTSSGLVEPVEEIGRLARRYGAIYLLDATQSAGHLGLDVGATGSHAIVATGRKFLRAPRGTAVAYVERESAASLIPTAPDVRGSQWIGETEWNVTPTARRFETWEASIAGRLGLGVALDEALQRGLPETAAWLTSTGGTLREALRATPGITIADPEGSESAIVTFLVDGIASAEVVDALATRGVRLVSVPATHGQWDLGDRSIASVVRASPHVYNDEGDLSALLEGVADLARRGTPR